MILSLDKGFWAKLPQMRHPFLSLYSFTPNSYRKLRILPALLKALYYNYIIISNLKFLILNIFLSLTLYVPTNSDSSIRSFILIFWFFYQPFLLMFTYLYACNIHIMIIIYPLIVPLASIIIVMSTSTYKYKKYSSNNIYIVFICYALSAISPI